MWSSSIEPLHAPKELINDPGSTLAVFWLLLLRSIGRLFWHVLGCEVYVESLVGYVKVIMDLSKHVMLNSEIEKLKPVTLPYILKAPESVEPVDTSAVSQIKADSAAFLEALVNKHESRVDAYKGWQKERNERIVRERRERAPGYDGLLEPVRKQ